MRKYTSSANEFLLNRYSEKCTGPVNEFLLHRYGEKMEKVQLISFYYIGQSEKMLKSS